MKKIYNKVFILLLVILMLPLNVSAETGYSVHESIPKREFKASLPYLSIRKDVFDELVHLNLSPLKFEQFTKGDNERAAYSYADDNIHAFMNDIRGNFVLDYSTENGQGYDAMIRYLRTQNREALPSQEVAFMSEQEALKTAENLIAPLRSFVDIEMVAHAITGSQLTETLEQMQEQDLVDYKESKIPPLEDLYVIDVKFSYDGIPFASESFGDLDSGIYSSGADGNLIISQRGIEVMNISGLKIINREEAPTILVDKEQVLHYLETKYRNMLINGTIELTDLQLIYCYYDVLNAQEEQTYYRPTWQATIKQTLPDGSEAAQVLYVDVALGKELY